jgi:hypothetical protein
MFGAENNRGNYLSVTAVYIYRRCFMSRTHAYQGVLIGGLLLATVAFATPVWAAPPSPQVRVYVQVGPPRPLVEYRPVAPGPEFVWMAGYYHWTGRSHEWVAGHWERAPRPRAQWAPGQWKHDRRGWYFVDGHWR